MITGYTWHFCVSPGVGLTGTYFLQKLLTESGRNDLMYLMTNRTTYPGYGYMVANGATTTWEYWSGKRSHIHNCYNAIGAWFYQGLAGIRPDPAAPGFRHFTVQPAVVGDLNSVHASYESVRGPIGVQWERSGRKLVSG